MAENKVYIGLYNKMCDFLENILSLSPLFSHYFITLLLLFLLLLFFLVIVDKSSCWFKRTIESLKSMDKNV